MQGMQLSPVVAGAGLALKPLKPIAHAVKPATVPNRAPSYGLRRPLLLLPRIHHSSSSPLRGMAGRRSSQAPMAKARDEAEREAQAPPGKQGEKKRAAERRPGQLGQRSMAYRVFADIYACVYICAYRTGELIVVNAQEGLERLRRYVRDNLFDRKR